MKKTYTISEPMTRKELADKYRLSDKTFRRRLERNRLDFGPVRILLPAQVRAIIEKLGHWEESFDEP